MIWIVDFPLPPSVNEYLMPVIGGTGVNKRTGKPYYRGRLVKTEIHNQYRERCREWALLHAPLMTYTRTVLSRTKNSLEERQTAFALKIDTYFVFEHSRIFTLSNKSQELDGHNRLKPLFDALAEAIGIDDRYFYAGNCEKVTCPTKDLECTMIRISLMKPRTKADIRSLINSETTRQASSSCNLRQATP